MECKFTAYGHPNITARHKTTLEFTKDKELSLRGDCIVGVKADFSLSLLKKFIKSLKTNTRKNSKGIFMKIKIIIKVDDLTEEINCEINPDFNSDREMVIRKSDFVDERTFAVRADKSASELDKGIVELLSCSGKEIEVFVEEYYL